MANSRRKLKHPEDGAQVIALAKRRRATSYDVARLAGVSQSAVSRCFKPGASVSAAMRAKVMKAAAALEYQPNAIARGLITQRSHLVAVLVSGQINLYYPELLFRLTEELAHHDLRVLLFTVDSEADSELVIEQAWGFQVDGVISASHLSRSQFATLEKRGIPVVFFNRYFTDRASNVVYCDPEAQVRQLIDWLVDLGHRRFALIRGPKTNMVSRARTRAVSDALADKGLTIDALADGDFTYHSGAAAAQELMAGDGPRPTAIISVNDMMAMGCMDEMRLALGVAVPEDVSIASFDGIGMARYASYELTTIRQPIDQMCAAAAHMLAARAEQPEDAPDHAHEKRVFEGALIEGRSIAAAPCAVVAHEERMKRT